MAPKQSAGLGLWSGIGLVSANMIGSGVFLSAGFMAQGMQPKVILLSWLVGMVLALAGSRAYAEVATFLPRSGGEYRYLSDLLHPMLGYVAGWGSLLFGFAAPIAINVVGAIAFVNSVLPLPYHRVAASLLIALLALSHAVGLRSSKFTQNILASLKIILVVGFIAVGLWIGRWSLPVLSFAGSGDDVKNFVDGQFYIAYAFTGWNAAAYVAEEFHEPKRDVARAMMLGCLGVGVLYLLVNFVMVANLTPELAAATDGKTLTTGHLVMQRLLGPVGGAIMSVVIAISLFSAASAMTFIGPRIYAAMAKDGVLPKALMASEGKPPSLSIVLQSAIAVIIVWASAIHETLGAIGAVLLLFAALTCLSLCARFFWPRQGPRPSVLAVVAALIYVATSSALLTIGFVKAPSMLLWAALAVIAPMVWFGSMRLFKRARH